MDRQRRANIQRKGTADYRKKQVTKSNPKSKSSSPDERIITWTKRYRLKSKLNSRKGSNFSLGKCAASSKFNAKGLLGLEKDVGNPCDDSKQRRPKHQKRLKRKRKNGERDEVTRLQGRARYLLIKMKLEQNLIDAYSGDGWNGQSREKIKPEKELQRAGTQILKCKLGIRDAIRQLDMLGLEGSMDQSVVDAGGPISHEHIYCLICKSCEAFSDNCIIRCNGDCKRGLHQKCSESSLEKDEVWICKYCNCKAGILEVINAHLGTCFAVNCFWEDIFKEAAADIVHESSYINPVDWPSEDSEDVDYDPDKGEDSCCRTEFEDGDSVDTCSSSSQCCSSDDAGTCTGLNNSDDHRGRHHFNSNNQNLDFYNSIVCMDSGEISGSEVTNAKRQRKDIDYRKLHDEMFGQDLNENEQSEDEDWGPSRKKHRRLESSTVPATGDEIHELPVLKDRDDCERKPHSRIPSNMVEKLRQVFAENELPSRSVKENLSEQLGMATDKVVRWFKNARYAALKGRKARTAHICMNNSNERLVDRSEHEEESGKADSLDDTSYLLPLSSMFQVPRNLRSYWRDKAKPVAVTSLKRQWRSASCRSHDDKSKKLMNAVSRNKISSYSTKRNLPQLGLSYHEVSTWSRFAAHCFSNSGGRGEKFDSAKKKVTVEEKRKQAETSAEELRRRRRQQVYMLEMERVCRLQDRLLDLKRALEACQVHHEPAAVMYVPVVEVKEKD